MDFLWNGSGISLEYMESMWSPYGMGVEWMWNGCGMNVEYP